MRHGSILQGVDAIGVDDGGDKNPEEKRHPCSEHCKLSAVIRPELVAKVDAIHIVVVVVNQLGDP